MAPTRSTKQEAAGRVQPPNLDVTLKVATPTDAEARYYFFFFDFVFAFFAFFATM
jgi:hypothetical protein